MIDSGNPIFSVDDETVVNRFNDYVITALRTVRGFDALFAERMFGTSLVHRFWDNASHLPEGVLIKHDGLIAISEANWLASDAIMRELILD